MKKVEFGILDGQIMCGSFSLNNNNNKEKKVNDRCFTFSFILLATKQNLNICTNFLLFWALAGCFKGRTDNRPFYGTVTPLQFYKQWPVVCYHIIVIIHLNLFNTILIKSYDL